MYNATHPPSHGKIIFEPNISNTFPPALAFRYIPIPSMMARIHFAKINIDPNIYNATHPPPSPSKIIFEPNIKPIPPP